MTTPSAKHISLPSVFSEGDTTEWFKRYEICWSANEWGNEKLKAIKLPALLEGEASVTWLELTSKQQSDYRVVIPRSWREWD